MISALLSSDNKEEEEQETTSKGKGFNFFFCFHAKYFQGNLGNISILKRAKSCKLTNSQNDLKKINYLTSTNQ